MIPLFRRASNEHLSNLKQFLDKDKLRFNTYLKISIKHDIEPQDFHKREVIGVGSYGRVYLAVEKRTNQYYALKQIRKKKLVEMNKVCCCWNEKRMLQSTNFPFVIYLNYFFIDNSYIYFVMPFLAGGELFTLLYHKGKFSEQLSKFYAAQIILALEYLHYMEVVHRNLKPETIMIDIYGYIKLVDLRYCKRIKDRTYSLCGTPEYIAPEVLLNKGYGCSVDWWALGVLIYEMNYGAPPFQHFNPLLLYEKIIEGKYKTPTEFSESLNSVIECLIQVDVTKRIGNLKNGITDIKKHKWFNPIIWMAVLNREIDPPYKPVVNSLGDVSNFETFSDEIEYISDSIECSDEFNNF